MLKLKRRHLSKNLVLLACLMLIIFILCTFLLQLKSKDNQYDIEDIIPKMDSLEVDLDSSIYSYNSNGFPSLEPSKIRDKFHQKIDILKMPAQKPSQVLSTHLNYDQLNNKHTSLHNVTANATNNSHIIRRPSAKPTKHKHFLVILVVSAPGNVLYRQAIRKTWARDLNIFGVTLRFLVGRNDRWDDIVSREVTLHNDVIFHPNEDVYESLPQKVFHGFSWALSLKPRPSYVMKVDDDTILYLPLLVDLLNHHVINSTQILGSLTVNSPVVRDPSDKWAVSQLDFPFSTYPPYVSGGAYVMSTSAILCITSQREASFTVLHKEDVLVTGVLARRCQLTPRGHAGFAGENSTSASACDFLKNQRVSSINHKEKDFYRIHEEMQEILRTMDIKRNLVKC